MHVPVESHTPLQHARFEPGGEHAVPKNRQAHFPETSQIPVQHSSPLTHRPPSKRQHPDPLHVQDAGSVVVVVLGPPGNAAGAQSIAALRATIVR